MHDLFRLSISEDYCKPKLVNTGYSGNYAQYESKGDKILTVEEYLSLIEPYLAGLINDYKSKSEWKVRLTTKNNFISLKPGSDETRVMHTKSDNVEIRIGDVIKELFKSLLKRYHENLQEKGHYTAVKRLSGLLRGVTSNNNGDFYCLNCFHSFRTKDKFKEHEKICENHDYCHVEMPTKGNKIIKYNQGEKSIKLPFVIYADLECLLEKMSTCYNNPEESSATEINKHVLSGYSIFTHCSFDKTRNKLNNYRGKDCMKKFCKDLREHATKIINYEQKKMIQQKKRYIIMNKKFVIYARKNLMRTMKKIIK